MPQAVTRDSSMTQADTRKKLTVMAMLTPQNKGRHDRPLSPYSFPQAGERDAGSLREFYVKHGA